MRDLEETRDFGFPQGGRASIAALLSVWIMVGAVAAGRNEREDFFEGAGLRLGLGIVGAVTRREVLKYTFQENASFPHAPREGPVSRGTSAAKNSQPRHPRVELEMHGSGARTSLPLFPF